MPVKKVMLLYCSMKKLHLTLREEIVKLYVNYIKGRHYIS